jgi:hypothetical protein
MGCDFSKFTLSSTRHFALSFVWYDPVPAIRHKTVNGKSMTGDEEKVNNANCLMSSHNRNVLSLQAAVQY